MNSVDTLVMGSISYEDVILSGLDSFDDKKILVASYEEYEQKDNVSIISGDVVDQVVNLKKEEGKNIWIFGGAGLADSFIKEDAIDEYVIAIIPTILGQGRRLFNSKHQKLDLRLKEHVVNDGIVVMTYEKRK